MGDRGAGPRNDSDRELRQVSSEFIFLFAVGERGSRSFEWLAIPVSSCSRRSTRRREEFTRTRWNHRMRDGCK